MSESSSAPLIRKNLSLEELLTLATPDELSVLVDILLSRDSKRLFQDDGMRQKILQYREQRTLYKAASSIAAEICALASNTIASAFRKGASIQYDEVVRDVARKLDVAAPQGAAVYEVEQHILDVLRSRVQEKPNEEEREASQDAKEKAVNQAILDLVYDTKRESEVEERLDTPRLSNVFESRLVSAATFAALAGVRTTPVFGTVATGMSIVSAYKRTRPVAALIIPAVVQIALIRRSIINEDYESFFSRLRASL